MVRRFRSATAILRRYLAPWYLAYLILGLTSSGMLPFLLPLAVADSSHDLDSVAYVMGVYQAGWLPAPLFGMLAERNRLFRPVFFGGFIALSLSVAAMAEASDLIEWIAVALLAGLGVGAVATVAPLFVVDFTPKCEWDSRIGWLQSCNGAGQLAGLLLASLIARGRLAYGFWLICAFSALALVLGRIGLPAGSRLRRSLPPPLVWSDLMSRFQPGPPVGGLLHHSHYLQHAAWRRVSKSLGGDFSRFLLAWALVYFGVAPFSAYYPLMMQSAYGVSPTATALLYALAAGVGIGLYVLAGRMVQQRGPRLVFQIGLALRMVGFGVLAVLALMPFSGLPVVAMFGFTLVMLAWPVLSVSSIGLAARLTPVGEGAAMGLLAASSAMATVVGTFLGGPLVEVLGYRIVPLIALAGFAGAEILVAQMQRVDAV
ncbi:MAG: MFS transporter [Candidatus Binataceae bacterium]